MSKAVLVLDEMPEGCLKCPIGRERNIPIETYVVCAPVGKVAVDEEAERRPKWCPLKKYQSRINWDSYDFSGGKYEGVEATVQISRLREDFTDEEIEKMMKIRRIV